MRYRLTSRGSVGVRRRYSSLASCLLTNGCRLPNSCCACAFLAPTRILVTVCPFQQRPADRQVCTCPANFNSSQLPNCNYASVCSPDAVCPLSALVAPATSEDYAEPLKE